MNDLSPPTQAREQNSAYRSAPHFLLSARRLSVVRVDSGDRRDVLTIRQLTTSMITATMLRRPRAITSHVPSRRPRRSRPHPSCRASRSAKRNLEARGLRITLAENIAHSGEHGYLAGDGRRAARDRQSLSARSAVRRRSSSRAAATARCAFSIAIDYDAIAANPRPIIGFCDLTALHQAIAVRAGVGSFHGPMRQPRLPRRALARATRSGSGRCSPARRR